MKKSMRLSIVAFIITLASMSFWSASCPLTASAQEESITLMQALKTAMTNGYDITVARETVRYKEAQVRIEKGEQDVEIKAGVSFDNEEKELTPYYQSIYEKSAEDTQTLISSIVAEKELESGISLSSGLSIEREDDNLVDSPPDNTSEVYFKVTLPVLKLWKSGLKLGKIKNSEIDLEAGRHDLTATVASTIENVAYAYWDALARSAMLENYKNLEDNARQFLANMTVLVGKNEYPAANLDTIQADLQSKEINRILAQQSKFEACQLLALQMGVSAEQLAEIKGVDGDFPSPEDNLPPAGNLIEVAQQNRPDLEASKIRVDYYKALLGDAEEDMLPDFELSLKGGYQGLEEDSSGSSYYKSTVNNVPGPTYSVGVSYTVPLGNNVAGGEYQQARVSLVKEENAYHNLFRTITSEVLTAHSALQQSIAALKLQQKAVNTYKNAMDNETIRFRLQMASLSDQMDARDDYYNSLNRLVAKQQDYAKALVRLHQACGTLVEQKGDELSIRQASLYSPALDLSTM